MFRLLTLFVCAAAGFAQAPAGLFNQAPPEVDQALRARITEFFQDHVDGKYRQAEALVAEDTKDFFYTAGKPKYASFEIQDITYSDGYTRAKAIVLCEQYVPFPGFAGKPVKIPTPAYFKLIDGQWYWYVDQAVLNQSPFGPFKAGAGAQGGRATLPDPEAVLQNASRQVIADKNALSLKPGGSGQVTIANQAPGVMTISVFSSLEGIAVAPDHVDIKAGEKATITLRADSKAKPGLVSLRVEQTNVVIPIQVSIP